MSDCEKLYICDGTRCKVGSNVGRFCKHTTDISHARYDTHERFIYIEGTAWELEHDGEKLKRKDFRCMKNNRRKE